MPQRCVHVVLVCSRRRHAPYLEPDTLERGGATTVRAGTGERIVVKRRAARGRTLVERLVEIEPVMSVSVKSFESVRTYHTRPREMCVDAHPPPKEIDSGSHNAT